MKEGTFTALIIIAGIISWLVSGSFAGLIAVLLAIALFRGLTAKPGRRR
jgi:hypothetical protein